MRSLGNDASYIAGPLASHGGGARLRLPFVGKVRTSTPPAWAGSVADLTLYGRPVRTVYDLLGKKENDLTYSLGWALAQSRTFSAALLAEAFDDDALGSVCAVRLQQPVPGGGFTDIELESARASLVLEAKRGWDVPTLTQLTKYVTQLERSAAGRLLVVAEASAAYAASRLPATVVDVPVVYRSWQQLVILAESTSPRATFAERRLLREFTTYLRGLVTMQNVTSNLVYVVPLGSGVQGWCSPLTPVVRDKHISPRRQSLSQGTAELRRLPLGRALTDDPPR